MDGWLFEYKDAAHRTRWIGLIGAALMLAVVARELIGLYIAVSWAEVPFQGDFAEVVMAQAWMLVLLGGSSILRAVFLLIFKPERYSWIALSWLLSFAAVIFYLWQTIPSYGHSGSADWVGLACLGFLTFSFFRVLVTATMAGSRYRLK